MTLPSSDTHDVDVSIVGAGPAGLAAALELRRLGVARVLVVDREEEAGGIPRHAAHIGFGMRDMHRLLTGPRYAARYVRLAADAGVELRTSATVTGWVGPTTLSIATPAGLAEVRSKVVVLATGCRERPRAARLVPGTRPLGVLTTGALQQFVYLHRQPVGWRAVVVGAEHVSFSAVLTLAHGGAATVAMVTEYPRDQTYAPFKWITATRLRVPILTSTRVTQILGRKRVEAVEVTDLRTGAARQLECDTVVFTGDWIPDHELPRRGGVQMDPATRAPRVDCALRTSACGVFAAGNLLHGAETADVAALSGRHAARGVYEYLEGGIWPERAPIPVVAEHPLRWVSPSAVNVGVEPPRGRFLLRVAEFRAAAELSVSQGDKTLWRRHFRALVPNVPIHVPATFVRAIDASGPPLVFGVTKERPPT